MAKEKKPSIYVDRGTIGSSNELDEYGVWIKSDPRNESFQGLETGGLPGNEDLDFEIPGMEDFPDFDAPLKETPENTIDGGDFEIPVMEPDDGEDSGGDVFNFGDFTEQVNAGDTPDADDEIFTETSENLDLSDFDESAGFAAPDAGDGMEEEPFDEITDDEIVLESDDEAERDFSDVSMDDFIGNLDTDGEIGEIENKSEEPFTAISFRDDEPPPEPPAEVEVPREKKEDLSTQLLMKIAEELSSIRTELSTLKKEFSGIKVSAAASKEGKEAYLAAEDDEKISLTGDELDNILNTADFTEEAGSDATIDFSDEPDISEAEDTFSGDTPEELPEVEPAEDPGSGEPDTPDFDYLELDPEDLSIEEPFETDELSSSDTLSLADMEIDLGTTGLDEPEGETKLGNSAAIDLDDTELIDDSEIPEEIILDLAENETEELNEIREKGAEPMTFAPAPEDTEYLEMDPLADESLELLSGFEESPVELADLSDDSIDLSEAVIDEPDLSFGIQDNPIEEPSPDDISINLDLSELESLGPDPAEFGSDELDSAGFEPDRLDLINFGPEDISLAEPEEEMPEPEFGEPDFEELNSAEDTDTSEGGDLALIPEGFAEEPEELVSLELSPEELSVDDFPSLDEDAGEDETEETITIEDLDTLDIEESPADAPEEIEEFEPVETAESVEEAVPEIFAVSPDAEKSSDIPSNLKYELKTVLSYMDRLLESLPDEKIEEFARSEYYDTYKKLFKDLGLA